MIADGRCPCGTTAGEGDRIAEGDFYARDMATVHLTRQGEEYWEALQSKTWQAGLLRGVMTTAQVIPRE